MKKIWAPLILLLITIFGFYFRFAHLDELPAGLNWDEAAVGYNSYSLLKTGKDEFGRSWPLFIESFGDYKTGLYSILSVPIINTLGLSIFSIRILNVFVGTSLIVAGYFLASRYFKEKYLALIFALLLATSPFLIHLSRFTLEWFASLPLFLIGVGLIIPGKKWSLTFPLSAFFFGFSLYWYHSLRLFLPLFLLAYLMIYRKKIVENKKTLALGFLVGILTISPLIMSFNKGNVFSRPSAVLIFNDQDHQRAQTESMYRYTVSQLPLTRLFTNKAVYYGQEIVYRYLQHFSFDFLIFGRDATPRLSIYPVGKLQLILLPFLLIGLAQVFINYKKHKLLIAWLLLSPIPSSLTNDAPHGLRSVIFLPAIYLVTMVGVRQSILSVNKLKKKSAKSLVFSLAGVLFFLNFFWLMENYFLFYPEETAQYWQADQPEMIAKLRQIEDNYQQVVVTKVDGQPHIFYAFFTKYDPAVYQTKVELQKDEFNTRITNLGKITFDYEMDYICQPNTLIVTKDLIRVPGIEPIITTTSPNRFHQPKEAFYFYETENPIIKQKLCK